MDTNAEFAPNFRANYSGYLEVVNRRLKKLRRERRLVERAILNLTELSRARAARQRRDSRI